MNKLLLILVALLSLLRIETTWMPAHAPVYAGMAKFNELSHCFLDYSNRIENWRWQTPDPVLREKLLDPEKIPVRKAIKVVFLTENVWAKPEYYIVGCMVAGGSVNSRKGGKTQLIAVHCAQDSEMSERFDTLLMPNGSIATLLSVVDELRAQNDSIGRGCAIDGGYPGPDTHGREQEATLQLVRKQVRRYLADGNQPVVSATVLAYNAESSLNLLWEIKAEFGSEVRTMVGGQLIRTAAAAYAQYPFVDHVGVGDAEVILGPMLRAERKLCYGELDPTKDGRHFAGVNYDPDRYLFIRERATEAAQYRLGPYSGINYCVESCRECSWARAHGGTACRMCALKVNGIPVFRPFEEYFAIDRYLAETLQAEQVFDTSNTFLAVQNEKEVLEFLNGLCAAKKKFGGPEIRRYVYLTANLINEKTAPKLYEAGVRIAYVGIDGWTKEIRRKLMKAKQDDVNLDKMFAAAKSNGLFIRTSLVIGDELDPDALKALPEFLERTLDRHGDTILTWGNFLEIILQGSPVWNEFKAIAYSEGLKDVQALYRKHETKGFLAWPEHERLTELYIRHTQPKVTYEQVVAARDEADTIARSKTIGITIRDGGKLQRT